MKRRIILLLVFSAICLTGFAQLTITRQSYVDSLFQNRKEVYFKFFINSRQEINTVTKIISIDNVTKNKEVFAYANKKEFAKFLQYNYKYAILPNPGEMIINPKMLDHVNLKQIQAWDFYPTYNAYETMMNQFALSYPSLCNVYTIQTLASGRKLILAKISHNVNTHENEPQFLYTSTMHGNETSGFVLMLRLIDTLLTNYGTNPGITSLLDNTEIWICPLANPDGTYMASGGSSIVGAIRYNANGYDLNRNYPDPVGGPHPDGGTWQPETVAFMNFADTMNFVMAANFHEGAELVNYPWDCKATLTADDTWWQLVSRQYADTAQIYGTTGYFTDQNSGITNGYAWYQVLGGRQDYMNYFKQCREATIEISSDQSPSGSELPTLWAENNRSFFNYMEQSLKGIRGLVTDSCTGQGIKAKVFIAAHDFDSSHVYSALPLGNYHRPIFAGTYNVTYSAPAYQSKTINNISVSNGNTVVQNIVLIPVIPIVPIASFAFTVNGTTYDFTNTSTGGVTFEWSFGDGNYSTLADPSHSYTANGIYTVQLIAYNACGSDTTTAQINVTNVGLNQGTAFNSVEIYPNPTNNYFSVTVPVSTRDIQILNYMGQIVQKVNVGRQMNLNFSLNENGIYFIQITTDKATITKKVIVYR